jgi:hypothetical protein
MRLGTSMMGLRGSRFTIVLMLVLVLFMLVPSVSAAVAPFPVTPKSNERPVVSISVG